MAITSNVFKTKRTGGTVSGLDSPIAIADGGTGQITASAAMNAIGVPSATAENDFIVSGPTPFAWVKKTIAEIKTLLFPAPGPIGATTAGTLRALLDEDVESTTDTLSANQCAGGLINNYGQAGNVVITLPAAAEGMNFRFVAGSTAAFYIRFDPNASDKLILDGVAGDDGDYVGEASVTIGDSLTFEAFQTGAGAYDWNVTSGLGSWALEA
jgi:hypothetical protein